MNPQQKIDIHIKTLLITIANERIIYIKQNPSLGSNTERRRIASEQYFTDTYQSNER